MIEINNIEWSKLKKEDIELFLSSEELDNDENFFFEFKQDEEKTEKIAKEVSAFANTFGGYIFLGVSDDKRILGCSLWNEERIASVLHDRITPIPDFSVRKFVFEVGPIYIIKIEEGSRPPYITNTGYIFERVSSESIKITRSDELNRLYSKGKDSVLKTREKIELPPLEKGLFTNSLCGYIDMGFDLKLSTTSNFQEHFYTYDLSKVIDYLKTTNNKYSVSRIGWSYLIAIGEPESTDKNPLSIPSGLRHFIEILADGSIRTRILLFDSSNGDNAIVDNAITLGLGNFYKGIYKSIFGDELIKHFVYARKYEKLTVLKQFRAGYVDRGDVLDKYNLDHTSKYGSNFIINGSRIPWTDYLTIDKQYFNKLGIPYNVEELYSELFGHRYFNLGFIDNLIIPSKDEGEL